jgi:hypothetical protein
LFGSAVRIAGRDQYIQIPHIGAAPAFTLAFWFKPERLRGNEGGLFVTSGNARGSLQLIQRYDSYVGGRVTDASGFDSPQLKLVEDQWHHIALRYGNDESWIFVNGRLDNKYGIREDIPAIIGPGKIGGWFDDEPNRMVFAVFDDIRLYKRMLADDEIRALVGAGQAALE